MISVLEVILVGCTDIFQNWFTEQGVLRNFVFHSVSLQQVLGILIWFFSSKISILSVLIYLQLHE
jgi:hypothetical protein